MSAELMKSKFVRRLSVCPWRNYLWTQCTDFFQILVVASLGPYARILFFHLWFFFIFKEYFSFSLTWDLIEQKISKRYSSYKSQPTAFNFSWNFFPMVLTKMRLGFLKFWKLKFNEFIALVVSNRGYIVWGWWCPTVFVVFQPNFFSKCHVTGLTKVAYRKCKNSKFV